MIQGNILGTEKISKLFVKFSFPAILSLTIRGIQTMVDGIFLGNFVGTNASVNIAAPLIRLMNQYNQLKSELVSFVVIQTYYILKVYAPNDQMIAAVGGVAYYDVS